MATVYPTSGLQWMIDLLDPDGGVSKLTNIWVAWGTGAGTAVIGDTALDTEGSEARVTVTHSQVTTVETGDTYQAVGTITADGTKTIVNAGLFTASTVGVMLLHGDFAGLPLDLNDKIEFTCKHQQKNV